MSFVKYLLPFCLLLLLNACSVQRMVHKRGFNLGLGSGSVNVKQAPKAFSIRVLKSASDTSVQDTAGLIQEQIAEKDDMNEVVKTEASSSEAELYQIGVAKHAKAGKHIKTLFGDGSVNSFSQALFPELKQTETDSLSSKEQKKTAGKGMAIAALSGGLALGALAVLLFFSSVAAEMIWLLFLLSLLSLVLLYKSIEIAEPEKTWFEVLVKLFAYPAMVLSAVFLIISGVLLSIQDNGED